MCQTVASQVTVASKHLAAAAAGERLEVCMGEKVSFQVTSLIKGSSACGTFVRRFLHMQRFMNSQRSRLTKSLAALLTFEGFLLGVNVSVVSQVVLSPEGLLTDVAGVRPLVRVRALVDQQIVGLGEVSPTKLANKFLFGFGRESPARGLPVRREFAQLGAQFGDLTGFRRIFPRRRDREVGEVKSGSVLVKRGNDARHGSVFGVEKVRGERKSRGKRKAGVHEALNVRVTHSPGVQVHGLNRTNPVQSLQMIHGRGESVDRLQKRVVELQGRVKWNRGR